MTGSEATTQPTGSIYQQVLQKQLANQANDPASVQAVAELIEAKASEVLTTQAQQANFVKALDTLSEVVDAYAEDEKNAKFAKAVELLTKAEFDQSSPEGIARLQKVAAGQFTKADMKELVKKHFDQLVGEEKKQQNGLTGMQPDVSAEAAAAAAQAQKDLPKSAKELNEPQRELYYGILAEFNRNENRGADGKKLTDEQIHEDAMKRASKKFKEGRLE